MRIGLQSWGSEGDIRPFISLAARLVRSGHTVTLAVTDNVGRDYSPSARQYGFELIEVRNPLVPQPGETEKIWRDIIEVGNPIKQAELVMKFGFDPVMQAMFKAAGDLCANSDAVVGHFFVFPLQVAAEKAGIPMATVNVVHNCLPSARIQPPGLPYIGKWAYPLGWKLVGAMLNKIFLPRVNALRVSQGLIPHRDLMRQTWASERLNLLAVSPSICDPPPDWGPRNKVCGFFNPPDELSSEQLPLGLDEFLSSGEPPIYFTFGSMMLQDPAYIQDAVSIWSSAVSALGRRAIFQLPWDDLARFDSPKGVFKVVRSPYRKVFPGCSVIVHHGGAGTTQSSLLAERPSVVVAHMADQFFWGSELERLGVAGPTQRRKGLSSAGLSNSLSQVLAAPQMTHQAKVLGSAMASEDGTAVAVSLIERYLTDTN